MTTPLSITSPSHPEAVGLGALYATLGFLVASDRFPSKALSELIGPTLMPWWGVVLMAASLVCTGALLVAPWLRVPSAALWVEFSARLVVSSLLGLYTASIADAGAPFTLACFVAFPLASLARCWQIVHEQRRVRAAIAAHRVAEVTADPRDDG